MKYEKSCGAIVYHNSKDKPMLLLLLRHRQGGHWSFPKGHMEQDETEIQTALREIMEETGLAVELHPSFRNTVTYQPKAGTEKIVVYFLAESREVKYVRQEAEINEIRWMTPEAALHAVTFSNDRILIIKALKQLEEQQCI